MNWSNFVTVSSIWILNTRNGGNDIKIHAKGMFLGSILCSRFMNALTLIHTIWAILRSQNSME
jgi:hypothetical protein